MKKNILFIQGGGEGGYGADKKLVMSLKTILGNEYNVKYPEIIPDESVPDFGWTLQIGKLISEIKDDFILVGHSFGASMLLKFISENSVGKNLKAVFLISTPFWTGDEDWKKGIMLKNGFAACLPEGIPIYFYHCEDDKEVPIAHLDNYKQKIPRAIFRKIKDGGHQLNNDLTLVARDILRAS